MTLQEWERVLSEAGFVRPACYPRDAQHRFSDDAGLIVAEVASDVIDTRRSKRDARIRERIAAIETCGAEFVWLPLIFRNRAKLRAIEAAEARFGPIHGVIHSAGVLGQTLLHEQSAAEVRRVFAPKVDGTIHLAAALGERPLDFFLCSSMSAIDPIPGQFDYSAANAFLDSFVHARAARCRGLTVSIDWGFWQELGMIDTARITDAVKQATLDEIQTGAGVKKASKFSRELYRRGAASVARHAASSPRRRRGITARSPDPPRVFSSRCPADDLRRQGGGGPRWYVDEHRVSGQLVLPGTSYLDLVAAFCHAHARGPVELRDVCFLVPMIFGAGVHARGA